MPTGFKVGLPTLHVDLSVEIGRLGNSVHTSMPTEDRDQLTIDFLVMSMDSRSIQRHLLTANTTTVVGTVQAIEDYLTPNVQLAGPSEKTLSPTS